MAVSARITLERRRPLRQGELDGLCGVYAVVNALRYLSAEINVHRAQDLFTAMMQARERLSQPHALLFVTGGLSCTALLPLLKCAIAHAKSKWDLDFEIERLRHSNRRGLRGLWAYLQSAVAADGVAIVAFQGRQHHWSVVVEVSRRQMRLHDSDGMTLVRRAWCTTATRTNRYVLGPAGVILVRRVP